MDSSRQTAFQKLRPICVELSSTGLKFKTGQIPVKNVLHAVESLLHVLRELEKHDSLDEKLAEYVFFPLSHIFNEAQRLSSRCLETAVECTTILVAKAWRRQLKPEMGKQLLILMTILAGGSVQKSNIATSDELKVACCDCIAVLADQMRSESRIQQPLSDSAARSIVDRLFYLLLDMITDSESDSIQYSATQALLAILRAITDLTLVASLLPRTVSSLVKVLRSSSKARRPSKVLAAYLGLLTTTLCSVLTDSLLSYIWEETTPTTANNVAKDVTENLDSSWLNATAPQVKSALIQVSKLRYHSNAAVRQALLDLCVVILRQCQRSLPDTLPIMIEAIASMSYGEGETAVRARAELKEVITAYPTLATTLVEKLYDWSIALPRIWQGSDDRPKEHMLAQYSASFLALSDTMQLSPQTADLLSSTLISGVAGALDRPGSAISTLRGIDTVEATDELVLNQSDSQLRFQRVLLNKAGEQSSTQLLEAFFQNLQDSPLADILSRALVNEVAESDGSRKLATLWLATRLLQPHTTQSFRLDEVVQFENGDSDITFDRAYLVSDLYGLTVSNVIEYSDIVPDAGVDSRLCALSLEVLVLQALQLGKTYRPELIDTLYPVLSLVGSRNNLVRRHALTALDLLAQACKYKSVQDLLVDNVDYLVNSIAMKLNAFDLSPQGPQVLLMMVRLCGVRLLPYLDDLIASIFTALDTYHGYPRLVEVLFEVLGVIVDEATKIPHTMITENRAHGTHRVFSPSTTDDILNDLKERKSRKRKYSDDTEQLPHAPHRPWSRKRVGEENDGSSMPDIEDESNGEGDYPPSTHDESKETKQEISKSRQLLLNIAQATAPHLTSPSPQVRHTLLQLIAQVSPSLAQNEDTFLPLINLLWPGIASRLLSTMDEEGSSTGEGDTMYNICSAVESASMFCEYAGDFMSTRIEAIFERLVRSFKESYDRVYPQRQEKPSRQSRTAEARKSVHSDLFQLQAISANVASYALAPSTEDLGNRPVPSTHGKILKAFTDLLVSIIGHVRISEDQGDQILNLLGPLMNMESSGKVREALSQWNEETTWLFDRTRTTRPNREVE